MPDLANYQLPPPADWPEFERLCCDLWRAVWQDDATQQNGRSGQPQNGVDVWGRPGGGGDYVGIQCKGKDNYAGKRLSEAELRREVGKAKDFVPPLSAFIIATTGPKDVRIEQVARGVTQQHQRRGLFSVSVFGWQDIVRLLGDHQAVAQKYYSTFFKEIRTPAGRRQSPSPAIARDATGGRSHRASARHHGESQPSACIQRGLEKVGQKQYAAAVREFSSAISIDPRCVEAYFERGMAYFLSKDVDRALEDHARALQLDENCWQAYANRASVREFMGDRAGALQDVTKAIALNPSVAALYISRGRLRAKSGDHAGALEDYSASISIDSTSFEAYYHRGICRFERGDVAGALADFEQATERNAIDVASYVACAKAKAHLGDDAGAERYLTIAIRLDPRNWLAYYNRAMVRVHLGDNAGVVDLSAAIRLNSKFAPAYLERGKLRRLSGDLRGAERDFSRVIALSPGDVRGYLHRGLLRAWKNDKAGARSDLTKAIQIEPENATIFYWRAKTQETEAAALADYAGAIRFGEDSDIAEKAYVDRGATHSLKAEYGAAIQDFDKALEMNPNNAEAFQNRAVVRKLLGDLKGAIADFDRAIESNPGAWFSYIGRASIRRQANDVAGALSDYRTALEKLPAGTAYDVFRKALEDGVRELSGSGSAD